MNPEPSPAADLSQHPATAPQPVRGLTLRAFIVGTILLFGCVLWVRTVELVTFTCQITEATPPITALASLLLLALLRPGLRKLGPKFCLSRAEQGVIFVYVAIGSLMSGVGVAQAFLPYLSAPFYFASPENNLAQIDRFLPAWLGVHQPNVFLGFYEGSTNGVIPWAAWVAPLARWTGFFLMYWFVALCMWTILRRHWSENERLTYPLLTIPLSIIDEHGGGFSAPGDPPFFRNPLMWAGFGVSFLFNITNILHAFNPSVAALGFTYPLGAVFTERPLNALNGLQIWHRPELIGLGYLVSLEILFSTWFFFLVENVLAVLGVAIGRDVAGFPYQMDQSMGAYFAMAFVLLWTARRQIALVVRTAFGRGAVNDASEALPYRLALLGLVLGFSALVTYCHLAGMAIWVAVGFIGMLLLIVMVYCRIRCETGTPSVWTLPHSQLMFAPFTTFGSDFFKVGGSAQTMSAWSDFLFLVHGGFFNQTTVYGMESMRLSDELGIRRRHMLITNLLAVFVGLIFAYWMFLTTYYHYGANVLAGGATNPMGGVRVRYCLQAYTNMAGYLKTPVHPDLNRVGAEIAGAAVTIALVVLRGALLRLPLHPLGFIMATAIGMQMWWAFFIAWIIKVTVLRLGGVQLYKRLIPAFLGLALGHFFTAGILWGSIAMIWPNVNYVVWFT